MFKKKSEIEELELQTEKNHIDDTNFSNYLYGFVHGMNQGFTPRVLILLNHPVSFFKAVHRRTDRKTIVILYILHNLCFNIFFG